MKYFKFLFTPLWMGVLFILLAMAMAVATFIENDFGSASASAIVYNTRWFELIFILLAINMIGQLINYKLFRREKLTTALFHLSFIIMIIGAGITRYFGWEGSVHIREGEEQNLCYSNLKYIGYSVKDKNGVSVSTGMEKYSMLRSSAGSYKKNIKVNNSEYQLILSEVIPNAAEVINDDPEGEPVISFIVTKNMTSAETLLLKRGDFKTLEGVSFGFGSKQPADVSITIDSGKFFVSSAKKIGKMNMMTQEVAESEAGIPVELAKMQILVIGDLKVVPQQMSEAGKTEPMAVKPEEQPTGQNAFVFHLIGSGKSKSLYLWNRSGEEISKASCNIDGSTLEISFGSKAVTMPFALRLNDFVLERYPGSSSPSGFKSKVTLIDKNENIERPFDIFMNNVLKYKGYRFYQSSYDRDEKGTILSVNHDKTGMMVTYTGYGLLFLFIILALFNKNSVFYKITAGSWNSALRKTVTILIPLLLLSANNTASAQKFIPGKSSSDEVGRLLVQDQKGRTKPLFTLSNDILRKVTRTNQYNGLTSMQVFLGIYFDFDHWKNEPFIKVSDKDLQRRLGIRGKYASFTDLVDISGKGTYKIADDVNTAYSKAPSQRNKTDKEIMKVDERVNIIYMIYKGDFLRLFPFKNGSHDWGTAQDAIQKSENREDSVYLMRVIPELSGALAKNDISSVREVTGSISSYQKKFSGYSLPSAARTNAELLYYRLGIFEKLFPFYATVGLIMLIALITLIIKGRSEKSLFIRILGWLLFTGFLFHTSGLALRWYISGHSPMSNGYESMIFISWATLLAGFIFSRKSTLALSATAVLGSMTLMVAHLSFMDPEITNLVPVLKSYWLTLHVSVITGSYGFLGLGAILGLISLILFSLSDNNNRKRISDTIDELTVINYKTLTLGLYFLTIGTFLGAVWANESWGAYWSWDPKETWSLITIILYSFVIHSRMIPGMKDIFTFNLISILAFSSVLMTYFGVNYYLSGMHSYAAGDPVPVPAFVYIVVLVLIALSLIAYRKYKAFRNA